MSEISWVVREKLVNASNNYLKDTANFRDNKSDAVLRKIRFEMLGQFDRTKDDIVDSLLGQVCAVGNVSVSSQVQPKNMQQTVGHTHLILLLGPSTVASASIVSDLQDRVPEPRSTSPSTSSQDVLISSPIP
ncbi:hypothetical protein WA026_023411 [Henosepilachna vigintioctopunctata]|uniref:Uncharacterized protein n=1 Tax=Henosepilachna vigintioctopunctata TaxID=420089 RepID=A0AAW1TQ11_9CUCU